MFVHHPQWFILCTVLSCAQFKVDAGSSNRRAKESPWVENQCRGDACGISQLQVQQGLNSIASLESVVETPKLRRRAGSWDVIGPAGPKYSDIAQGELGTCYFLAVLIAIARVHPQIIDGMFVNRELWNATTPIYTTKWLVDGRSVEVAVDDKVPINPETGKLVFVNYNDGANFWPIILEKSWAKIFGAYKLVDGGTMAEAFKAITQAPVEVRTHDNSLNKERLWAALQTATALKFPVCAGSRRNWVGIPSGHAYAVFNVSEVPVHGKIVLLYNPWAEDRYHGSIPNPNKEDGLFHMTFDEYVASYHHTTFAVVRKEYTTTARLISTHAHETTIATELFVENDEPFHVQLEWPDSRFTEGCKVLKPRVTMAVAKHAEGALSHAIVARQRTPFLPVYRADMPGSAGRYLVFVTATFPNGPWLEEIVLNAYGAKGTEFRAANLTRPPFDYFLQMHGMCQEISVEGLGEFEMNTDQLVGGVPSFSEKTDGQKEGKIIYWDPELQEDSSGYRAAFVTGHNTWKVAPNMMMAHLRNPADEAVDIAKAMSCVQDDWLPAVLPTEELSLSTTKRDIIHHRGNRSSQNASVQILTHSPSIVGKKCQDAVRRLLDLSNAAEITQNGSDPLFPPDASSIGSSDDVCGDVAADIQEQCSKYNHWDSFGGVMAREEARHAGLQKAVALQKRCIAATPTDELCLVKNTCDQAVPITCDTAQYTGGKSIVHHKLEVPPGASGFADIVFCHCESFSALLSLPRRVATAHLQHVNKSHKSHKKHLSL